ncbi:hypothetical protein DFA_02431 [Cavenderia fasciculata]|uniref:Uncharacterized protein n=1 Tax=Cavenderia fasciculata TaxID=261658 RepID=F4PZF4_CACFS|nr:uncharacterized protein DFA_02431 [Cavenderia fasciculata]EGG19183.1 hypothetical protein DFA_02431 [Cavenderia fasciculata]|eukprot:XP_004366816.1 hypothetical protein DFA_02431 [Cavenderia fasciculata]
MLTEDAEQYGKSLISIIKSSNSIMELIDSTIEFIHLPNIVTTLHFNNFITLKKSIQAKVSQVPRSLLEKGRYSFDHTKKAIHSFNTHQLAQVCDFYHFLHNLSHCECDGKFKLCTSCLTSEQFVIHQDYLKVWVKYAKPSGASVLCVPFIGIEQFLIDNKQNSDYISGVGGLSDLVAIAMSVYEKKKEEIEKENNEKGIPLEKRQDYTTEIFRKEILDAFKLYFKTKNSAKLDPLFYKDDDISHNLYLESVDLNIDTPPDSSLKVGHLVRGIFERYKYEELRDQFQTTKKR